MNHAKKKKKQKKKKQWTASMRVQELETKHNNCNHEMKLFIP
jgi:hypothetical protein